MEKVTNKTGVDSLKGIVLGVILPVLILDYCSGGSMNPLEPLPGQRWWELGPAWAMVVALCLPIGYGTLQFVRRRGIDLMSSVGLVGVLLTGTITLCAVGDGGRISTATPWWFAAKEAMIPLILAAAVLLSARSEAPLLRTFLYSPDIFDVARVERRIEQRGVRESYSRVLWRASAMLAGSLALSSVANFCLALHFLLPVLRQPAESQQVAYNYAVGSLTWWGFLVIGVPLMATLLGVMAYLLRRLGKLTGLDRSGLLLR